MSYFLAILSTLIGILDFIAFNGLLRALLLVFIPVNSPHSLQSHYLALTLERVGLILFGIAWLAGVIFVFYYYNNAKTRKSLLVRFGKVTVIELAIVAIGYAVPRLLALLYL